MITNHETGTRVDEIADGIYRICTPLDVIPGGFTFNSYLIADDEPLLFHTGYKKLFPITVEAVAKVTAGAEASLDRRVALRRRRVRRAERVAGRPRRKRRRLARKSAC